MLGILFGLIIEGLYEYIRGDTCWAKEWLVVGIEAACEGQSPIKVVVDEIQDIRAKKIA